MIGTQGSTCAGQPTLLRRANNWNSNCILIFTRAAEQCAVAAISSMACASNGMNAMRSFFWPGNFNNLIENYHNQRLDQNSTKKKSPNIGYHVSVGPMLTKPSYIASRAQQVPLLVLWYIMPQARAAYGLQGPWRRGLFLCTHQAHAVDCCGSLFGQLLLLR